MKIFILEWILKTIMSYAKDRPYKHLEGYMNRWWIAPYGLLPFDIAIRIHEIKRSDISRDLHDHPWNFLTIILKGGYWEETLDDTILGGRKQKWHPPGSVRFRKATNWHRLLLDNDMPCWTLFISFKKKQSWGFRVWDENKQKYVKIPWREYTNDYTTTGSSDD